MYLTRKTEIAIGILVACAGARGRLLRTGRIANFCGASKDHAAQVASQLSRAGGLECYRGRGDGLTLAEGMEALPIGEIVLKFQPQKDREPFPQALGYLMQEVERSRLAYLDSVTVTDLARIHTPEDCPKNGKSGDIIYGQCFPIPDSSAIAGE